MKKIITIVFLLLTCFLSVSAGGFSDTKKFDQTSITNLEIDLMFESLTVSTWQGNQIVVVLESNKKDIFPLMNSENKKLQIYTSHSLGEGEDKEAFCDISLMLPENYRAEKIVMKVPYRKLDIKKLSAKSVSITPGPDNSLANITADYFEIPLPDQADINISNLDCKSFDITLLAGDANLSLARAPEKKSKLSVKEGKLNVRIPDDLKFTLQATSYHSKFINNFTGDVSTWARDGIIYKHNDGGPEIELRTFKGDITVGKNSYQN